MKSDLLLKIYMQARRTKQKVETKPVRTYYNANTFG